MDLADQLGKGIIFKYLSDQIEYNRTRFSETGRDYIGFVKEFFDDILNGLESITDPKQDYFLMDNLHEIYEIISGEKEFSSEGVNNSIRKIHKSQKQIDRLLENPEKFYQSKDVSELSDLCKRIRYFYEDQIVKSSN